MSLFSRISMVRFLHLRVIPLCVEDLCRKQGASVFYKSLHVLLAFGRRRLENQSREKGTGRATDKTVGEAETSYEHTVLGDRRGQAICLALPLGRGLWYRSPACSPADQSWTVCVLPHPAAWMDSGESERRPVAVEMCTTKWIGSRFQLPSRKGKIFSFPRNYLLFRLRAIKYNGCVSAPLSAADVSNPTCTCEEGGER